MTSDSQRNLMEKRDARIGVRVEDALAEIEALKAPEPVTVAEFARTPETRQALGDVLPPDELAELERDLEQREILTAIYEPAPFTPDPTHMNLVRETVEALKSDAKANGWTAQRNRAVSEHRAGEGREARNAKGRGDYASMIWETEGRAVRDYEDATPERRRDQNNTAQAKRRANMTPEQREEEKRRNSEAKARKRAADRLAKAAALKDGAIV